MGIPNDRVLGDSKAIPLGSKHVGSIPAGGVLARLVLPFLEETRASFGLLGGIWGFSQTSSGRSDRAEVVGYVASGNERELEGARSGFEGGPIGNVTSTRRIEGQAESFVSWTERFGNCDGASMILFVFAVLDTVVMSDIDIDFAGCALFPRARTSGCDESVRSIGLRSFPAQGDGLGLAPKLDATEAALISRFRNFWAT